MRIQHNIMAMNAYRNYNTNTSALSKNLEKLSSGYKINRAGDDAAGLAISEKMRAQITGLNAAQKNVKDGISLVKTAEGAMQEIQDMLNRMDYLATQSANGTYQDEVDREALQKEVNQLMDEIDRIADSANFNGIKLLDGSKDGTGASLKAAQAAAAAAADNVAKMKNELNAANNMKVAGKLTAKTDAEVQGYFAAKAGNAADPNEVGKTIFETDEKPTGPVGFTVDLDGVKYTMAETANDAAAQNEKISLKINNGTAIEITQKDITDYLTETGDGSKLEAGDVVTGTQLAEVVAKKLAEGDGTWEDTASTAPTGGARDKYKVTNDGTKLVFAAQNNQTTNKNRHYDVSISATNDNTNEVAATKDKLVTGALSKAAAGTITKGEEIKIKITYKDAAGTEKTADVSYMVQEDAGGTVDTADQITAGLVAAINKNTDLKALFKASGTTAAGGITLEALEAGEGKGDLVKLEVTSGGTNSQIEIADGDPDAQVQAKDAYTAGLGTSYVNKGTENIVQAGDEGKAILASTVLNFTDAELKDGTMIQLGNEKYRIALGENSAYKGKDGMYNSDEKVVYLDDEKATIAQIASKLAQTAKDNATFTVSHVGTAGQIGLKQKEGVKETTDMSTLDNFSNYVKISTITTAGDEAVKTEAIAKAQANYDDAVKKQEAADAKVAELSKNPGKALQLQIGDTSDGYNQLQVNIGSMKTSALGISDLDIGTAEKASGAIATIKDAINNVSSVRGDLGAYQNRLEHTANNLSVMAENITDAESTIRDTDVAEEMMAYTKNNILIQSAQAMLAQANAVPQGVLQLLG